MTYNDDGPRPDAVGGGNAGRSSHQGGGDDSDSSRKGPGTASPHRCPDCLGQAVPGGVSGVSVVRHQYGCPADKGNRDERRADVEALGLAGDGAVVRRPMRPAERAELALATGRSVSRAEARRRWKVAVRHLPDGRRERAFLRDGRAVVVNADWFGDWS